MGEGGQTRRPIRVLYDSRFLAHGTDAHPERPERLRRILPELKAQGLWDEAEVAEPTPAGREQILLVHQPDYVRLVEQVSAGGGGYLDLDTLVTPGSYDVALLAAGAAIQAAAIGVGERRPAFALVRPPGHHATANRGMGFCLFNSVAIAAAHAVRELGTGKVAIVDWDLHHGNGTQDAFFGRSDVLYLSIHEHPKYPGTGARDEIGVGEGEGYTVNVPLPAGAGDDHYHRAWDEVLAPIVREFGPELLLVSAGYDAHFADPIGGMRVTVNGFRGLAERATALAEETCGGRLGLVLEGGYDLPGLSRSVAATLAALVEQEGSADEEHPPPLHASRHAQIEQALEMVQIVQRRLWRLD